MNELNKLAAEALRIATEHGFKDATPLEDMALIHSEVSEAVEDIRTGRLPADCWYRGLPGHGQDGYYIAGPGTGIEAAKTHKPCGIPSEMADIIIRVLHFSAKHGIDIGQAVKEKMAYNESRPYKHGKVI